MNRKPIIAIVVIALISGGYWYETQRAEKTGKNLILFGNVDIRQVDLAFRVGGRVASMRVEEGDTVKTGDVVATLDPIPFRDNFDAVRAAATTAEAQTSNTIAQHTAAKSQLATAQANLKGAEATLAKVKAGNRVQEIQTAAAQLAAAQVTYNNAEKEFVRQDDLAKQGTISQQQIDNIRTTRDNALARLNVAKETLNLMQEGSRMEDIAAANAAREAAMASVDTASANLEAAATAIDAARANLAGAVAQAQAAQTQLDDTVLTAPADGIVLTRVHEPGEMLASGATVLTLTKSSPIWIRAYVPEPMLGNVKPGMKVQITTDTAPDKPLNGSIGYISSESEFTPKTVQTPELRTQLVYRFRVIVDSDSDNVLRQGMPVTIKPVE